jgi:hypothetical protein
MSTNVTSYAEGSLILAEYSVVLLNLSVLKTILNSETGIGVSAEKVIESLGSQ